MFKRYMKQRRWGRKGTHDEILLLVEDKATFAIEEIQDLYAHLGLTRVTYPQKTVVEKVKKRPTKEGAKQ